MADKGHAFSLIQQTCSPIMITSNNVHISLQRSDLLVDSEITVVGDGMDTQRPDIVTTAEDWEGVQIVEPG